MKIGDTVVWCPAGTSKDHLWIIISDPAQHDGTCVVINLTDSVHGKHSLTLKPGQHKWIYKDSDVNFGDAFPTSEANLLEQIAIRAAVPNEPMDPTITAEIIQRAHTHPAFQPILRKFLPPKK